ncbi:PaaI family thioesterase [Allohahella marinimesophila]|uniref:PaaI family thioesterase n=1 Tax=Allohahella marinimesophila TaxID=1054972 RepID=A0ABP7NZB6_9GAMM
MLTLDELTTFFNAEFPHVTCTVESVGNMGAVIRQRVTPTELRPGGTVAGPVLMSMADIALYAAILGEIGLVPLAVTTSLNINFLRRPSPDADVIAECRLIKLGKTLAVGEVSLYSEGIDAPVAHAVGTYSIPPR